MGGIGASTGAGGSAIVITMPDAGADRSASTCGNGVLDETEQCDDGNTVSGDGCSRICQVENNYDCPTAGQACVNLAVCGNGVLTSDETCDDGNTVGGDGCSADCSQVEPGWLCLAPGVRCDQRFLG